MASEAPFRLSGKTFYCTVVAIESSVGPEGGPSGLERLLWEQEAAGSSPAAPTNLRRRLSAVAAAKVGYYFTSDRVLLLRLASHPSYTSCMWHYVYILQNEKRCNYVGLTDNVEDRLIRHNRGEISSTSKYGPWNIIHFSAFVTREKAAAYEKYLKSGSGRTFRQRHLI